MAIQGNFESERIKTIYLTLKLRTCLHRAQLPSSVSSWRPRDVVALPSKLSWSLKSLQINHHLPILSRSVQHGFVGPAVGQEIDRLCQQRNVHLG
jgi:hypothetical protein